MTARGDYGSMDVDDEAMDVVLKLHQSIKETKVDEILKLYKRLLSCCRLPPDVDVFERVDRDDAFCSLYVEICHRYHSSPTLDERIDSWFYYCYLLQEVFTGVFDIQLPYEWLWDMVDEFVNQFHSFSVYWATKTDKDITQLIPNGHQSWGVFSVLHLFQTLQTRSSIVEILDQAKDGGRQLLTSSADDCGESNVLKVLGYLSMVALLRVHCLLGNYQTGLDCVSPIDISQQGFYTSYIATHVTTIYHYGFANLMLGRYLEAIREFNKILAYVFKTKQQNEQVLNMIEQMYALLAICLSFCPSRLQHIDKNVHSQLMKKYGEQMERMKRYDDDDDVVVGAIYRELLSHAWPAFSKPFAPNSGDVREFYNKEQLAIFDDEDLVFAFPEFFGPNASSYGRLLGNHSQLEPVIANMLQLRRQLHILIFSHPLPQAMAGHL